MAGKDKAGQGAWTDARGAGSPCLDPNFHLLPRCLDGRHRSFFATRTRVLDNKNPGVYFMRTSRKVTHSGDALRRTRRMRLAAIVAATNYDHPVV